MSPSDVTALETLARLLLEHAGLKITPDGFYGLRLAIRERMLSLGIDDEVAYVRKLSRPNGASELRALLPLVTVGKTEFFRDARQFEAFSKVVLPEMLAQARRSFRKLRMWSAGCATGEEAYSLAMAALEAGAGAHEVEVVATDLSSKAVETAQKGVYARRRMVGVTEARLARFFSVSGNNFEVRPFLRSLIQFECHNLAQSDWPATGAPQFDVIFCRNVIIYFDQPTIEALMQRFYDSLYSEAWMFLGYSETLFKFRTRFEMRDLEGTFAYFRAATGADIRMTPLPQRVMQLPRKLAAPPAAKVQELAPGPMSVQATVRYEPISPKPSFRPLPTTGSAASTDTSTSPKGLSAVIALTESGQFKAAEEAARRLLATDPDNVALALTLGGVYAVQGNIAEARTVYTQVLEIEPLCVEARVYAALVAVQALQFEEAKVELGKAIFLEPTLALPHYLMGLVMEKLERPVLARRAYRNATLQRSEADRNFLGHFPDVPTSNRVVAQVAQYRLAALSETETAAGE
jgi:chemotaxis protein methyltransferase CheR